MICPICKHDILPIVYKAHIDSHIMAGQAARDLPSGKLYRVAPPAYPQHTEPETAVINTSQPENWLENLTQASQIDAFLKL